MVGGVQREAHYAQRVNEAGERIGESVSQAATAFRQGAGVSTTQGVPPPPSQSYVAPPPVEPPPARPVTPTGAIVLIGLGVLFLLGNMGILHGIGHWWPVFLIGIGLWLIYQRQQRGQ
jgi:hypothetical protein